MAEYKVGDKFVIEIESIENGLPYPYIMKDSEPYSACELDVLEQLTDGMDTDSYKKGATDAWEIAGLICKHVDCGGLSAKELNEIFNTSSISKVLEMPYKEVKDRIEEWKKAKEEIKVGDVVKIKNNRNASGIVFAISGEWCSLAWSDGYCGSYLATDLIKTGENHADKVADLLGLLK